MQKNIRSVPLFFNHSMDRIVDTGMEYWNDYTGMFLRNCEQNNVQKLSVSLKLAGVLLDTEEHKHVTICNVLFGKTVF